MTITTELGIISGMLPPIYYSKGTGTTSTATPNALGLSAAGFPAAFVPATPGLAGATINGVSSTLGGTIPFVNSVSGNSYLAQWSVFSGGTLTGVSAFDFLWYNTGIGITTTTAQTVNSVTLPARDANGATNGVGVSVWLYCSATTGNLSAITNTTISYTNAAGASGLTGSTVFNWPISGPIGSFVPFSWNAGDTGVQSIQSITLGTSYVSGTVNILMIRDISYFGTYNIQAGQIMDWAQCGFPILYNGTALSFWVMASGAGAGGLNGNLIFTQG